MFDIYPAFQLILKDEQVSSLSNPISPCLALPSFIHRSPHPSQPSLHLPNSSKIQMVYSPSSFICPVTHQIQAGTMFELVKALNHGAETLKNQTSNSISLNAGCELFIAFVTLFPHDSAVCLLFLFITSFISFSQNFTDLKKELVRHGQTYATEALTYRKKIAELAFGFIKDGSVVSYIHLILNSAFQFKFTRITFTRYSHILIREL